MVALPRPPRIALMRSKENLTLLLELVRRIHRLGISSDSTQRVIDVKRNAMSRRQHLHRPCCIVSTESVNPSIRQSTHL